MASLQLGIGTTNDIVDAVHDRGRKPGKPIPAGYVTDRQAKVLASTWFVVGIGLCASAGPAAVLLGLTVIAIGLAYDLRLKGTRWSWLPFAIGIPILPVFGWAGATGGLHPAFALLVPAAVAAGAALAIGNALVDVERDGAAGQSSIALSLGPRMAASVGGALTAVVTVAAVVSGAAAGEPPGVLVGMAALGAIATAAVATAAGRPVGQRERAWQVEAVALAGLAILWVRALLA